MRRSARILAASAVFLVIALALTSCTVREESDQTDRAHGREGGAKAYYFTVEFDGPDDDLDWKESYDGWTDAKTLLDLMEEVSETSDFYYSGSQLEDGFHISWVGEISITDCDFSCDIYINNELTDRTVDKIKINDGDNIRFICQAVSNGLA